MATVLELLFNNSFDMFDLLQKYDEDGYPIEEELENDIDEDDLEDADFDDGFESEDDIDEDSWE